VSPGRGQVLTAAVVAVVAIVGVVLLLLFAALPGAPT
jgi:hypothetical protein